MSDHINLDALWVLGLPGRAEAILYDNGVTSISQLRILVQTGSVRRFRGIGPTVFQEIKQTLAVYDETVKDTLARKNDASGGACWKITIGYLQTDDSVHAMYEQEYQPGTPIPVVGSYVLLPNSDRKHVVESVFYSYTHNWVVVILSKD